MPSLHLFIDTNVLLSFYAYATDDIEQLKKLVDLIKGGALKLYISRQVADEFGRNREVKLAASINEFNQVGGKALPRFLIDYEEAAAYQAALTELHKARNALVQKAQQDAATDSFAVDKLVGDLFSQAAIGEVTQDMIARARLRRDLGNPPGKPNSLGDQINWEYLLETVPEGVTLHIVSKDGDFQNAFKNGKLHQYLLYEWQNKKNGDLCLHKEIKPFLNAQFENIKLEIDREKDAAVSQLMYSGSFAATHSAIPQIEPFFDALTTEDATKLFEAALDNSQIRWIATDGDVQSLYNKLLDAFADQLDAEFIARVRAAFAPEELEEIAEF